MATTLYRSLVGVTAGLGAEDADLERAGQSETGKAVRNSSKRVGLPLTVEVWAGSSRPSPSRMKA